MATQFSRFFSYDSAKAIKAQKFGWLNAINYMAPHKAGGRGNLCGNASPGCIALCLGWHSGNAELYSSVRDSRIAKARLFMDDRAAFMAEAVKAIDRAILTAHKAGLMLCVRMNGSSDIPWEAIHVSVPYVSGTKRLNLFELFPSVQFVDYTKNVHRALKHAAGKMPANYHVTFSRSETNEADCDRVLAAGGNVAVVSSLARPEAWRGYPVIDGDESDLRHLDGRAVVVWLSPKGRKAKADLSGFVLR